MLMLGRNQHNTVKQLSFNYNKIKRIKIEIYKLVIKKKDIHLSKPYPINEIFTKVLNALLSL